MKYLRHRRVVEVNEPEIGRLFESVSNEVTEHETRIARIEEKIKQLPDIQREVFLKILGISLDSQKAPWVNAIKKHELN